MCGLIYSLIYINNVRHLFSRYVSLVNYLFFGGFCACPVTVTNRILYVSSRQFLECERISMIDFANVFVFV